jgi:hypothetical protein
VDQGRSLAEIKRQDLPKKRGAVVATPNEAQLRTPLCRELRHWGSAAFE